MSRDDRTNKMAEQDNRKKKSFKVEENLKTKEDSVKHCIANITEAVTTVVSHSTNDEFRQKCFSLMKVSNSSGLGSALSSKLKSIAHQHLGVTWHAESSQELTEIALDSRFEDSNASRTPTNSQPCSSQLEDQTTTPSQSAGLDDVAFDDDFSEFPQVGFFDDKEMTSVSDMSHQILLENETGASAPSTGESSKSVEISQSSLGDDWFDEVLNSDLFLSES